MSGPFPVQFVTYRPTTRSPASIGLLAGDRVLDLPLAAAALGADVGPDMIEYLQRDDYLHLAKRVLAAVADNPPVTEAWGRDRAGCRLLAPIPRPNSIRDAPTYLEHVRDGMAAIGQQVSPWIGKLPGYYKGNPSTVIGPDEPVHIPSYADTVDFEMELCCIIRRRGESIAAEAAADYIGGYTIFNDASARGRQAEEQNLGLGPAKGKDFDNGNVLGPVLVPSLDIDTATYDIRVNGVSWASGGLAGMHWTWGELIEYISTSETLYPGDLIAAGTVPRGCGLELGRYPQPGDVVELEVSGIGVLRSPWGRSAPSGLAAG